MGTALKTNEFFDINKLPPKKGLLLFGLSMNKLSNRQNAENCFNDIRNFSPDRISKPLVGCNFIYTDFLYLYNDKPASELKHSFMNLVIDHRNAIKKLIEKNFIEFQIQHAFNYMVWNQLYVGTNDFNHRFEKIKQIYKKDEKWQRYMNDDCGHFGREADENQVNYFLEESLMVYLLNKNQVKLPNEYIENNQEWVLFCYPGRPVKSIVYIHQLNPFDLDWEDNRYQNSFYDLDAKQLIDCERVDLETYTID
jgi:hypothetical protein